MHLVPVNCLLRFMQEQCGVLNCAIYMYMCLVVRKPVFRVSDLVWSDTNQAVQQQKLARGLKIRN